MLPNIKRVVLPDLNLPTKWQTVIFRNYGYVSTDKIAKTIECSEETVKVEAEKLGLANIDFDEQWEKSGYITIIRNNWFLLPYEQLTTLLGFSETKLDFVLKEEDFLSVKLGEVKPECEKVAYAPLDEQAEKETRAIGDKVRSLLQKPTARPFAFFDETELTSGEITMQKGDESVRIVHGFLTPCGDPFAQNSEDYLPDTLLQKYQLQGINGLWMHGLLSALSPYPFKPSLSEGYQERREKLKNLIARCKKYGIKVWLYFCEPRFLPIDDTKEFSHLLGHKNSDGNLAFCMEQEEVREYLYTAVKDLVGDLQELGGIITITMSEYMTHCHSTHLKCNCPRCSKNPPQQSAASVNNTIMRAIRDSGAKTELIANLWGWSEFMGWTDEMTLEGIDYLDKDVSVLSVSEYGLPLEKGGVKSTLVDYSISNPGPSEITIKSLSHAREKGHKVYAKMQVSNSWEASCAPYMPVFDLVKEHLDNLAKIGVNNYMLSWTLGGYPSPALNLVAAYGENFDLREWYRSYYGEAAEIVANAVKKCCDGFREYPFAIDPLYFSPKTLGPANLWSLNAEEKESSMVCYAFDDYQKWMNPYPYEVYVSQFEKLLKGWKEGLDILKTAPSSPRVDELLRCSEAIYIHFKTDLLQSKFSYLKRDKEKNKGELKTLCEEEKKNAETLLGLVYVDAKIGYEASNHYFYNTRNLIEKILQMERFIQELS